MLMLHVSAHRLLLLFDERAWRSHCDHLHGLGPDLHLILTLFKQQDEDCSLMLRLYQSPLSWVRVYGPLPIKIDCILCPTMFVFLITYYLHLPLLILYWRPFFFLTQHLYLPLSPGLQKFTVYCLRRVDKKKKKGEISVDSRLL